MNTVLRTVLDLFGAVLLSLAVAGVITGAVWALLPR